MVLDHIDWTVRKGENWAVLGPNGAGKSKLLELITATMFKGMPMRSISWQEKGKRRDDLGNKGKTQHGLCGIPDEVSEAHLRL